MELITERLLIRTLREADYPDHMIQNVEAFQGDPSGLFHWIVSQYETMDIENGVISLGIFERETGDYCGYVGAGRHVELQEPEIFYYLLPQKRGRGYAAEAAGAVTRWVFEAYQIPYLIGTVGVENLDSQKVLEKNGYQFVEYKVSALPSESKSPDYKYYRCYPEQ